MYLKSLEQVSVAVMMSTTLSHTTPQTQRNTWPTAVHQVAAFITDVCVVGHAALIWSASGERPCVSLMPWFKAEQVGPPVIQHVVTKPPCVSRPDGILPLNMRGKRSSAAAFKCDVANVKATEAINAISRDLPVTSIRMM